MELAFETGAALFVDGGTLDAQGTVADPVVFTSAHATPAAGDWDGLWVRSSPATVVRDAEVLYGGGNGLGGVVCEAADFTMKDTAIASSTSWGLYRLPGCAGAYPLVDYTDVTLGGMY